LEHCPSHPPLAVAHSSTSVNSVNVSLAPQFRMRTKKYQITKNKLRLQVGHIEYIVGWGGWTYRRSFFRRHSTGSLCSISIEWSLARQTVSRRARNLRDPRWSNFVH
jgi:hypothetical protein